VGVAFGGLIEGFGAHIYSVRFTGVIQDLPVEELKEWDRLAKVGADVDANQEAEFYRAKRKECLGKDITYLRLVELDGTSDMGVIVNFNAINEFLPVSSHTQQLLAVADASPATPSAESRGKAMGQRNVDETQQADLKSVMVKGDPGVAKVDGISIDGNYGINLSGVASKDSQVMEQFQDLIFTMQDAWGHVHKNGDEKLKRQWSTLMRSYGEFAEVPALPTIEGNRQLFAALVDGKACVAVPFTSEALRTRYARVLEQHEELAESASLDPRIRRLAFVNEWSDGLVAHAREHLQGTSDEVLAVMRRAAEDLVLSVLRGGDETLAQSAATALGFASADDLRRFQRENPVLSAALKAEPALKGGSGLVVGVSLTEVVFATEHGLLSFERAWLKSDVGVGDGIRVGSFGEAEVIAGASAFVYEPGQKYNGPIPEIKYLPVTAIHRQEMDFRPEVMTVSAEVANNMDFSEPVEVTAFRYGPVNRDTLPEVTLRDGHHRTAAAVQTGRPYLPVKVRSINARGEKLNALIAMSQVIEASLEKALSNESISHVT